MPDPVAGITAIEIDTVVANFYTNAFDSVEAAHAAIEAGTPIVCWWYRPDGIRFEEEFMFSPDTVRMIRTNRT